jgi:hypothetical protein
MPVERAAVEQDQFLRQPVQPRILRNGQARGDPRVAGLCAIDAFCRLRGQAHPRAGPDADLQVLPVTARQAPAGIDQHRLERIAPAGKQQLQRTRGAHAVKHRCRITPLHGQNTAPVRAGRAVRPVTDSVQGHGRRVSFQDACILGSPSGIGHRFTGLNG